MSPAFAATRAFTFLVALLGLGVYSSASVLAQERAARAMVIRQIAGAPYHVEFEALAASAASSGGEVVAQEMAGFGPGWGGNSQLFWRPPAPVDEPIRNYPHLSTLFEVPAKGEYELTLQHTLAPDYGQFTVLVAGRKAADVDGYGAAVQVARRALGRFRLDAGANQITFTVFGKAAASTGYVVGLDRLEAVPADAIAPPSTVRRNESSTKVALPKSGSTLPSAAATVGESAAASPLDSTVATHLIGEAYRPRLEARTWRIEGRGIDSRYEARRIRLDWDRKDLRLQFRWRDPAGAPAARWEIYSDIPPPRGTAQPIASGQLPPIAAGDWQNFEHDLTPYKPDDPLKALRGGTFSLAGPFDPGNKRPRLLVQVQPLDRRGSPVVQATNFIEVKFSPEAMGKLKRPAPALSIALVHYKPVKPYEERFLCWAVATKDGPRHPFDSDKLMWRQGDKRSDLCDRDDSGGVLGFFEDFGEALGGAIMSFVDAVGSTVDQASELYSKVKGAVVDLAVAPLSALGCGEACDYAVALGLDAALASVGVPPSLPNFDEVMQGLEDGSIDEISDVVVETAVSQGVPVDQIPLAKDAARKAVKKLVSDAKQAVEAKANAGGDGGGWAPDLSRAYSPGVLVFEVKNWGKVRSAPVNLQLIHENPEKVEVELAPASLLSPRQTVQLGGYEPVWLPVPSLEPGTSTRIAVTLTPEADPHLWLDLIYGRSSLPEPPPYEHCSLEYGYGRPNHDSQKMAACEKRQESRRKTVKARSGLRGAWAVAYARGVDSFRLRLFRFGDHGTTEGAEALATCYRSDKRGLCQVQYDEPTWLGKRIDRCLGAGQPCGGEPVAREFCEQLLRYPHASGAAGASDIGSSNPTIKLMDRSVCREPGCDGFSSITCSNFTEVGGVVQP